MTPSQGSTASRRGPPLDQAFLASYLIGLREGLEATLVVSILMAYLVKAGRRRQLVPLWAGVLAAVALSVLFGALLTYTETSLLADYRSRELFEAVTSVLAVGLVTWMVFWMRRTARRLKGELTGQLENALAVGGLAVAGVAFLSVVREGLETTLLFYAAAQGATTTAMPLVAITAGVLTAVVVGARSEEHTSELQSRQYLVCRLLLEKKKEKMTVCLQRDYHINRPSHQRIRSYLKNL